MRISGRHLEGLARQIHEDLQLEAPIDAFALAEAMGLRLKPWSKSGGMCVGNVVCYPAKANAVRQHGTIAHECGHVVLDRAGEDAQDEDAADYLASALMLPRSAFLRDLDAFNWDLLAIHERHPNASWQMLVVRCVQLASASASVWDAGHLHAEYGGPNIEAHRELVMRVLETGRVEHGDAAAYPVFSPGFRRVVCLSRAG